MLAVVAPQISKRTREFRWTGIKMTQQAMLWKN